MSREVLEKRICDICGKEMEKDGPIWYGGTVTIIENYVSKNGYPRDEQIRDVCRSCMRIFRKVLKLPPFYEYTAEEIREMNMLVDNVVRAWQEMRGGDK